MNILKRIVRGLCSQVFKFSIFFAAVAAATITVFGSPTNIKETLLQSNVYEKAVDSIIEQASKDQEAAGDDVPINDPAVQKAIRDTLSPEFLEQTSSSAIDGIFGWLQGTTERPEFNIDLNDAKERLANSLGDVALTRASGLPPCTAEQLQSIDLNNVDIFSLPCLPPGVNLPAERTKLVDQVVSGDKFLEDTTVSANDLPKENGKDVFDKAEAMPTIYQWLVRMPWILGGLSVLMAAGLILLHDDRRRGIWVVGRTLLLTGLTLVAFTLISSYIFNQFGVRGGDSAQQTILNIVSSFSGAINQSLIKFGIVYVVVGAGIMLGIHFTRPKVLEQQPEKSDTPTPAQPLPPEETKEKTIK